MANDIPSFHQASDRTLIACQNAIWSIRDNSEFPLSTRFEAAKWSAFIESGFYPDKPLYLPDELYEKLEPNNRNRHLRFWYN